MKTDPSLISVEDAVAGRRYWLTLMDREPAGPSYHGKVLDYDSESVTVEIECMGIRFNDALLHTEKWPRNQVRIEEIPDED